MSKNFELLERLKNERCAGSEYIAEPLIGASEFPRPELQTRTHAELNKLVQRLFLSSATPCARRTVFTSPGPRVGCTCVIIHTAEVLASQTAATTCLVDASMDSSALRVRFGLGDGPGFADVLLGNGPAHNFVRQVRNNLWVLTGDHNQSDDLVLFRPRLQPLLSELQREFDYILIDTAPISSGSSSLTIAALIDGAVLVLKAGRTKRSVTRSAIAELEAAGVRVLGMVLNQRDYPIPEAIYKRI
jgi:Mrp family chromosome partitioning ATPase